MAVAIEELTPEAQAVAARLHPGVKAYLEAKAGKQAAESAAKATAKKAASKPAPSKSKDDDGEESSGGGMSFDDVAKFERGLNSITPGRGISRSSAGGRLITAVFLGVLTLEVLSYALGQPFSYSLKGAAQKIGDLSKLQYAPLYKGQASPLASHGL